MSLLGDVGHGGMKTAGVEEVEDMVEDMTEVGAMTGIKGIENGVRKERRASLL